MAGYRGPQAEVGFLFFRLVIADRLFLAAIDLLRLRGLGDGPALLGQAGDLRSSAPSSASRCRRSSSSNQIRKRQQSMRRAFPDALDLLLICVESGMSIEQAFRRVSQEIGVAVRAAGRGAVADDRRAVLPAGPPAGLREPRRAHRARTRQERLPRRWSRPSATARRSARRCASSPRKAATSA